MNPPSVLFKYECDVSVRHDIMGGFQNTSLRGFYFQFVVSERTMHFRLSGSNNNWVHHYNVDGERPAACWRFVVKVEDITRCPTRAVHVITSMLRTVNIWVPAQPGMAWKIYSEAHSLARQLEHIPDLRIPIMVDIMRVFRRHQAIPNPDRRIEQWVQLIQNWVLQTAAENEDGRRKPLPAAVPLVAALEKVNLKPKESCSICLGGMMKATRMPCSHMFHERCIVRWLKKNNACPLCRSQFPAAN